ncbi:hypothetical protein HMPREF1153_1956 [Selenomonas sp. CM52]|nr:hypothetical protein HMPREF1153_1956 [Selenomonas sp. CM52]
MTLACAARTYECYDVHIFLSCFFKKLKRGNFPAKSLQKGQSVSLKIHSRLIQLLRE